MRSIVFNPRLNALGSIGRRSIDYLRPLARSLDPATILVVVAALFSAGWVLEDYSEVVRLQWSSIYHDRNTHYAFGLSMAAEIRAGNIWGTLAAFDAGSQCWPPLHGWLEAAVMTVLGPSPVTAVVPSLLGWVGSVVLAFLIARRMGGPEHGAFAGLIAALICLTSPALRAYAVDAMLESLGLCLSLASVHAYLRFVERPATRTGAWLGGTLSALFLLKYNYWLIVVMGLAATHVLRDPRQRFSQMLEVARSVEWLAWLKSQRTRPLNFVIGALLAVTAYTLATGGWALEWNGRSFGVKNPRVIANVAFGLILVRMLFWWRTGGRERFVQVFGAALTRLLLWASVPPALWLMLPRRLNYFIWFVSPKNTERTYHSTLTETANYYLAGFVDQYLPGEWVAIVTAAGMACSVFVLAFRRDASRGWLVVPVLLGLAAVLTLNHPNHKLRFLHSWAPLAWILAGVGFAGVCGVASRWLGARVGRVTGVLAVLSLGVALAPHFTQRGSADSSGLVSEAFAKARGFSRPTASLRDVAAAYYPFVDPAEPTAFFCRLTDSSWLRWSYLERFGATGQAVFDFREIGETGSPARPAVTRWLAATRCRTIVYVDLPPSSSLLEWEILDENRALERALAEQDLFVPSHHVALGDQAVITIWRRTTK